MNIIIVLSGPSGSGKSTLIQLLLEKHKGLVFSVSYTTRPKRENETEGIDYHFVSKKKFSEMIKKGEFVEWAEVHHHFYGTAYKKVDELSRGENTVVLDIDVKGARNIKNKFPDALLILVVPPSLEVLRKRLVDREHKEDESIKKRLQIATDELKNFGLYDYIVINNSVEDAFLTLDCIYIAYENSTSRKKEFIKTIIGWNE